MNIAFRNVLTAEEYLAWADAQTERFRSELINGQIVAMAPERVKHVEAKFAAVMSLKSAINRAALKCYALADGVAVRIDDHTVYEPDALAYCGDKLPGEAMIVPNPVIIVEVLSPSTAHTDTSAKLIGYFKVQSVQHYLVIDPDARTATHHRRGERGVPMAQTLNSGTIALDPPGITFPVADVFG
jgi:Uma2 family endonuclease